jgi:hypothetical protein
MSRPLPVPDPVVARKIYMIRGQRVMIDSDLAALYKVETKQLKRAVRRNITRFPSDFMFELKSKEVRDLRCHFGTSSWGGTRYKPMAFTEQGVAMLSSVLGSHRAIQVNIHIIRVFTQLREILLTHKNILLKVEQLERRVTGNDKDIRAIFEYIKQLIIQRSEPVRKIGFRRNGEV